MFPTLSVGASTLISAEERDARERKLQSQIATQTQPQPRPTESKRASARDAQTLSSTQTTLDREKEKDHEESKTMGSSMSALAMAGALIMGQTVSPQNAQRKRYQLSEKSQTLLDEKKQKQQQELRARVASIENERFNAELVADPNWGGAKSQERRAPVPLPPREESSPSAERPKRERQKPPTSTGRIHLPPASFGSTFGHTGLATAGGFALPGEANTTSESSPCASKPTTVIRRPFEKSPKVQQSVQVGDKAKHYFDSSALTSTDQSDVEAS